MSEMKLLLYRSHKENEIDEVLILVPADYDSERAQEAADDSIPDAYLAASFDVEGEFAACQQVSEYRPYIG